VVTGAILAVVLAQLFLEAFPVLNKNLFAHPELRDTEARGWQSAMTYKFVGVLNTLSQDKSRTLSVMALGVVVGLAIEVLRKVIFRSARYQAWRATHPQGMTVDFLLDSLIIASPYASSFGGFVDFDVCVWWSLGGLLTSALGTFVKRPAPAPGEEALPEDMSGTSLTGGGLIAGESLFALWLGISSLVARGALGKLLGGG
jgi:hypothetical protein